MNSDIYQKQYDFELEQRNAIASSTNMPIVSITVIGSALSSMVLAFSYSHEFVTYSFLTFVTLSGISTIISLVYIFKSVIGYSYQKIPSTVELSAHYQDLLKWHKENRTEREHIVQESKKDFDEYFEARLSEAAENNGNNNIKRGNYIHDSTVSIAFALAFMVLSSPFFIYVKSTHDSVTHKIEVVNPVTLTSEVTKMAENDNSSTNGGSGNQSATPAQEPATPAPTQAKPSGPPNTTFKGSVDTSEGKTMDTPVSRPSSDSDGGNQ